MKLLKPQTSKGSADWFTGDVYPTIILAGEEPSRVRMGSVHFSPARGLLGIHTPLANIYTLSKASPTCRNVTAK